MCPGFSLPRICVMQANHVNEMVVSWRAMSSGNAWFNSCSTDNYTEGQRFDSANALTAQFQSDEGRPRYCCSGFCICVKNRWWNHFPRDVLRRVGISSQTTYTFGIRCQSKAKQSKAMRCLLDHLRAGFYFGCCAGYGCGFRLATLGGNLQKFQLVEPVVELRSTEEKSH